ncbi:PREDICTED: tumor necrosis factor receptor superfamily member 27-like [Nanorana parkeri]|uniref:tumor necrosis factor receptor superfamily member 27-like n=1 Tax=Nanorana parkeri TaxID=125878 RepID=UPI00085498AD|nr:PREDICTED: tumor necrosis factor receptor superfamily member 27-like [Nanorana parkeri]
MAARTHLTWILFIFTLVLVCEVITDCQMSEYKDERGNCLPCAQCGPGEELSEDCSSARDIRCVPCRLGRYKEDRSQQRCLRCLPCVIINRVLKVNCTPTTNSVCGDCLPGFYSKTRIGGLQELECFPCTSHTPRTETQCHPSPGFGQPPSTEQPTPSRDPIILVAVIMVALALILVTLVSFSVICCGRFFKSQCQRAFQRSQAIAGQPRRLARQLESMSSPCEEQPIPSFCFGSADTSGQVAGPVEEVHVISDVVSPSPCLASSALLPPSVELCALPPPLAKPKYNWSVSETQPLIRNSGCSDCFSGCGPATEYSQGAAEPSKQAHSCASERQHWSHAPVECTELDLQNFSSDEGFSHTGSQDHEGDHQRSHAVTKPHSCSCGTQDDPCTKAAEEPRSSCCRNIPNQKSEDIVSCLNTAALDLPVSQMPDSLVALLALKLDSSTPGHKDFNDVGVALGVQPFLVDGMQGFQALHAHLSTSMSCTLLQLVQTLQRLQRKDAVTLICSHFGQ